MPGWRLPAGRQGIGRRLPNGSQAMDSNSYIVYALKSLKHNYIYVGMTQNLERRVSEHNAGACSSTRFHAPFRVIYTELQSSRIAARSREKYLKSGVGKEFLKSLIK